MENTVPGVPQRLAYSPYGDGAAPQQTSWQPAQQPGFYRGQRIVAPPPKKRRGFVAFLASLLTLEIAATSALIVFAVQQGRVNDKLAEEISFIGVTGESL